MSAANAKPSRFRCKGESCDQNFANAPNCRHLRYMPT
jgi:hypothetical protein